MLRQLRPALLSVLALTLLGGLLFPALITGAAQLLFPWQAQGSLLELDGRIVGSALIGQRFAAPEYFHPRPSAAGAGYDASASGGSNLGPTSQRLIDEIRVQAAAYRRENGLAADAPVPADAATRSASGLDPDISPANAALQTARVARARGISEEAVRQLIRASTRPRQLGILGEPRVNVLELNLALDRASRGGEP